MGLLAVHPPPDMELIPLVAGLGPGYIGQTLLSLHNSRHAVLLLLLPGGGASIALLSLLLHEGCFAQRLPGAQVPAPLEQLQHIIPQLGQGSPHSHEVVVLKEPRLKDEGQRSSLRRVCNQKPRQQRKGLCTDGSGTV